MIEHLWEDVLAEPINPKTFSEHIHLQKEAGIRVAKSFLTKIGLFNIAKKIYVKISG